MTSKKKKKKKSHVEINVWLCQVHSIFFVFYLSSRIVLAIRRRIDGIGQGGGYRSCIRGRPLACTLPSDDR